MQDNIYDALRESHQIQRYLCRCLLRAKPGDSARQQRLRELRIELAAHAAAEERFLYAPILMYDLGLSASRHAIGEHHEMDELVETLSATNISSRSWIAIAKKLSHKVHHHLKEEEKKFFQVSGKILGNTQKSKLAKHYRQDYVRMHRSLEQA